VPRQIAGGHQRQHEDSEHDGEAEDPTPRAAAFGDGTFGSGLSNVFAAPGDEEGDDDAEGGNDDVTKGGDAQAIRNDDDLRRVRSERRQLL
jgi:hypothetical protein